MAQGIQRHLVNKYGNDVMSRQQVGRWGRKFLTDVGNISDGNRSGSQRSLTREVNSARVEEHIQKDCSVTFSVWHFILLSVYRVAGRGVIVTVPPRQYQMGASCICRQYSSRTFGLFKIPLTLYPTGHT